MPVKKVEIDETEFLANQQLTKLFGDMLANPETRKQVLEAKKKIRPNEPIPELDAAQPLQGELAKIREELAADRKARADEKAAADTASKTKAFTDNWNSQRSRLKNNEGWFDEDLDKVEKLAQDRGIPDFEAAAALYERLNPPSTPLDPTYGRFDILSAPSEGDQEDMKKLIESKGDSPQALDNLIGKALADVRGQTRRMAA